MLIEDTIKALRDREAELSDILMNNRKELNQIQAMLRTIEGKKSGRSYEGRRLIWETLDWTKQDIVLAAELGMSRERVRQKRRQLGHDNSEKYKRMRAAKSYQIEDWVQKNRHREGTVTLDDVCEEIAGCSRAQVAGCLAQFNFKAGKINRWWQVVNWDLPTIELARIWGVSLVTVANYRTKFQQKAKWDGRSNRHTDNPEYLTAVDAEKIKKAEFYNVKAAPNPEG